MTTAVRLVLVVVGVAIGVVAVVVLRDATQSTHEHVAPDSRIELVVDGRMKDAEKGQTLAEMVQAQVLTCRLEVHSDVVGPIESQGHGRFARCWCRRWTRATGGNSAAASKTG